MNLRLIIENFMKVSDRAMEFLVKKLMHNSFSMVF